MKAKPFRVENGEHVVCPPEEVTHIAMNFPGPIGLIALPVILHGRRDGHPRGCVWTWNGSTDAPTLRPSVRRRRDFGDSAMPPIICHSWVSDGCAQFLDDSTHEMRGQTVPLLDVP